MAGPAGIPVVAGLGAGIGDGGCTGGAAKISGAAGSLSAEASSVTFVTCGSDFAGVDNIGAGLETGGTKDGPAGLGVGGTAAG